ncbi:MAG: SDR family NAD(P)-dependent oxidoreductase [Acidobacteriota bacterium]|nr:MAG: SDR family NAD(P)-dependent oxidoreductase [Acidobacteriota bacterium]
MGQLDGKIALVTGASSGIGRATARALAREGARVIAAARRQDRLEELCRELAAELDIEVGALTVDVRDHSDFEDSIERLRESGWDRVVILVNNAGLAAGLEPIQEGVLDKWNRMIDTNVKGILHVSRLVVPGMVERGEGHVVNIGSIAGREIYPNGNVYCATKAAVRALNKALRIDLCGRGIRVTSVDPGLVETEFSLVRFDHDQQLAARPYAGMTPLGPGDVADAVVWAVTRPPHVNVEEILLMPTDQASAEHIHRKSE